MKKTVCVLAGLSLAMTIVVGCTQSGPPANTTESPSGSAGGTKTDSKPPAGSADFLLTSEPVGGQDVIAVREAAANDDEVVIVGRIGGRSDPWVDGLAAFSIVDPSLKACSDIPGDSCPIPWDYCCETDKLPASTALVKLVDDQGKLVNSDARELLNVKELQTVVVRGKALRDDDGNLTILASGVYVRE